MRTLADPVMRLRKFWTRSIRWVHVLPPPPPPPPPLAVRSELDPTASPPPIPALVVSTDHGAMAISVLPEIAWWWSLIMPSAAASPMKRDQNVERDVGSVVRRMVFISGAGSIVLLPAGPEFAQVPHRHRCDTEAGQRQHYLII
jgi:hypothetical protein